MPYLSNLKYHYRLNYRRNSNILAEDFGVIYFNTQKNANSTLKAQFVEILGLPKTKNFPKDIHYNYDFPSAIQSEINSKYQDFLKFAVLRNPWERLFSCYQNKIAKSSKTGPDYILECSSDFRIGMSFEDFVEVVCEIPDSEADYHFCSQIYLMLYPDGTFSINYLCDMENLDFHIKEIKAKTGIPFTSLERINSSKKSAYKSAYSPKLIEKVGTRYRADIKFFNYKFGEKNEVFPFGNVSEDWKKEMMWHREILSILKEKNQELIKEIEYKNTPLIKKLDKMTRDYNDIKNSMSWKITAPLRGFKNG